MINASPERSLKRNYVNLHARKYGEKRNLYFCSDIFSEICPNWEDVDCLIVANYYVEVKGHL